MAGWYTLANIDKDITYEDATKASGGINTIAENCISYFTSATMVEYRKGRDKFYSGILK